MGISSHPGDAQLCGRIYVFGQVNSQGILRLRIPRISLAAIALAAADQCGGENRCQNHREYQTQREKPIILSANLDRSSFRRLAQNIRLRVGDVVYVPEA
jgi:protein involved in polysaccharide export with SLBB domain